ncbi:MAG: Holliday junction resolvase RuvX [Acidobacteriota bacterium]
MERGRILAIDYGAKNIGLACTDETGIIVRPLSSLANRSRRELMEELAALIGRYHVASLVVGMPWNMDGTSGEAARKVAEFMRLLEETFGLPLKSQDERLSTLEANELWKEMRPRQKRRYRTVDSLAAALILKRHLEEG